MKLLRKLKNYFFYCGIEKDEYKAVKKDAYVSNFKVWKILHYLMVVIFGALFIASFINGRMEVNRWYYFGAFAYSVVTVGAFYIFKKDSIVAQFIIYLSISVLFLFAALISTNNPNTDATTFIVLLVLTPMFMIDKPYFMTIELVAASTIFLIWMKSVKPDAVWQSDLINVIAFTVLGSFLNIIANSLRIREFVLTRQIRFQKDTDEMTGLKNKGSLTREINEYLQDGTTDKGTLFILDIDRFKAINDNYGHDVGDAVIGRFGRFLADRFNSGETVGRFGGDEFIVFIKNTDDAEAARRIAGETIADAAESVLFPDGKEKLCISIGIALYKGAEKNYSELFKKADIALYKTKGDPDNRFCVYED